MFWVRRPRGDHPTESTALILKLAATDGWPCAQLFALDEITPKRFERLVERTESSVHRVWGAGDCLGDVFDGKLRAGSVVSSRHDDKQRFELGETEEYFRASDKNDVASFGASSLEVAGDFDFQSARTSFLTG